MFPNLALEATWWREGYRRVAGVDEVGRGALFGPVVAAAVMLPPDFDLEQLPHLADSKLLSPQVRESLLDPIAALALSIGVAAISGPDIDRLGIQRANLMAMQRALESLSPAPDVVVVDGTGLNPSGYRACGMAHADRLCASVSAASIVAKVLRDRLVTELASVFPGYGLERHKGYGTPEHRLALETLGPTPLHRRSFAPVSTLIESDRPTDPGGNC